MNWLLALLRRSGVLPAFSADEMLNASTEEAFRIHAKAVQEVAAATRKRTRSNQALRVSIQVAKLRIPSKAEMYRLVEPAVQDMMKKQQQG
jgi:hypothetical protein